MKKNKIIFLIIFLFIIGINFLNCKEQNLLNNMYNDLLLKQNVVVEIFYIKNLVFFYAPLTEEQFKNYCLKNKYYKKIKLKKYIENFEKMKDINLKKIEKRKGLYIDFLILFKEKEKILYEIIFDIDENNKEFIKINDEYFENEDNLKNIFKIL